jgi:hypothetical protein
MLSFLSRSLLGLGAIAAAAWVLPAGTSQAAPVATSHATHHARMSVVSDKRYFVEFRGRNAASYGHLYVMYGQVNARGEIVRSRIAGLYPAGDKQDCENCSLANWMIGHLIFVPSGTTVTDGDLEEKYVTARYRVMLDKAQYEKVDAYIQKFQKDPPLWHAILRNCVSFGRDIANVLDLKVPPFPILTPEQFVEQLRELNGTDKEQAPLKDAATRMDAPTTAFAQHRPAHPHAQTATAVVDVTTSH